MSLPSPSPRGTCSFCANILKIGLDKSLCSAQQCLWQGCSLVEALRVVEAHFQGHALEELEGFTAQVGEAHALQVHYPDGGAQGQRPRVQHLPHVLLHKPKVPVPHAQLCEWMNE